MVNNESSKYGSLKAVVFFMPIYIVYELFSVCLALICKGGEIQ
jgi:hypothetical protein